MKTKYSLILLAFCLMQFPLFSQDNTSDDYWDQLHYALKYKIDKNFDEPEHKAPLEEYLRWIRLKGEDLKEVNEAYQELNLLYNADPDNEVYKKWMDKFYYLTLNAEGSGNNSVNGATMVHMRDDCNGYSPYIVGHTVRKIGRQIYLAAIEAGFDPLYPQERSNCLINCAIGLLESDRYGFSLYRDRERVYGYFDEEGILNDDNLDFDNISCVRRGRFSVNVEGEPAKELTYAFENVGEIMDECDWWGFTGERQDAEDLLIEYYKDALCKKPPNPEGVGHRFYRELAEERNLKEAVDYNNGFYGVLYGKVEVEEEGVKKRAPGAKVVFESVDEKWETTADENGEYRFEKVIMHKHCSPFHIWAEYKGDRVDDELRGTLEEPNPNAIRLKNLLIKSAKKFEWHGRLTAEYSRRIICSYYLDNGGHGEVNDNCELNVDMNLSIDGITFPGNGPVAKFGKVEASGQFSARRDDNEEVFIGDNHRISRTSAAKTFTYPFHFTMIIQRKTNEDPKALKERLEQLAKTDPMQLIQEMKIMGASDDENDFNNIEVYIEIGPAGPLTVTAMEVNESKDGTTHSSISMDLSSEMIAVKLTGTLRTRKDGTAEITASYDDTEYSSSGLPADYGCPDQSLKIKCELILLKRKSN
jgi:hypothetical protein